MTYELHMFNIMGKGEFVGTVALDLRRAFDLVNHEILLRKLSLYKCDISSMKWFKSYLINRKQCVQINEYKSELNQILCGVPQGSILGPLLFILFINDLPLHVTDCKIDIFADDTTIYFSHKDLGLINNVLQNELNNIIRWCDVNKLVINVTKTKAMVISTHQKRSRYGSVELNLYISSSPIEYVNSFKILGVIIDRNLSFIEHVNSLCSSLASVLCLFWRIRSHLDVKSRLLNYNSYFMSCVTYCINAWGCALPQYLLTRLFRLQKRAVRIVFNVDYVSSTKDLFANNKLLNIYQVIYFYRSIYVYKSMNNILPSYLNKLFSQFENGERTLRSSFDNNKLSVPKVMSQTGRKAFRYCGANTWNSLPAPIRASETLITFKSLCKAYILNTV